MFGDLALSAPNDPSPFDPSLTTLQLALLVMTLPNPPVDWHFSGACFNANGLPYDLRFTETRLVLDLRKHNEPSYCPWRLNYDLHAAACEGSIDVRFDDCLGDVSVPIRYVGAAGEYGRFGRSTSTLTRSPDVTTSIVQRLPDDQRMTDFGHVDLLTAKLAQPLVWKPILDWIKAHR